MRAPTYSVADFAAGLLGLLPSGPAWPRDPDSVLAQVVAAQAPPYERLHARANHLLVDAFPATTVELLPEWEATLGLPDPCAGPDPTIAQRQLHVVARLTQAAGPSIPSLTAYAEALGFAITITEFASARYGRARYGDRMYGRAWAHAWQATETGGDVKPAHYGTARYGDRYRSWGNAVLECELRRLAPAHTVLLFAYADAPMAATWDGSPGFDAGTFAA